MMQRVRASRELLLRVTDHAGQSTSRSDWKRPVAWARSFLLVAYVFAAGCVTTEGYQGRIVGATIGAGACYAICKASGKSDEQCLAIAAGCGVVGYALGALYDKRQRELQAAAERNRLDAVFAKVTAAPEEPSTQATAKQRAEQPRQLGMVATYRQPAMFASGSSKPSSQATQSFEDLGKVYAQQFRDDSGKEVTTSLLIIGHTDALGTAEENQRLSEARARQIAQIFVSAGLEPRRLYLQGAGSSRPVASNSNEAGREQNRRVEVVEIDSEPNLLSFADALSRDRAARKFSTVANATPVAPRPSPPPKQPSAGRSPAPSGAAKAGSLAFNGVPAMASVDDLLTVAGPAPRKWSLAALNPLAGAEASQPVVACYLDQPRVSGEVVRYSDNQKISERRVGDYLPGMYGTGWTAAVGNVTVGVGPVAVLKDDARAVGSPSIYVKPRGARNEQQLAGRVETIDGEQGVLYRIFSTDPKAPVGCADVVLPKSGAFNASAGRLFYRDGGAWKQATYLPRFVPKG